MFTFSIPKIGSAESMGTGACAFWLADIVIHAYRHKPLKETDTIFPLLVFLPGTTCNKLHGFGNYLTLVVICDQQVYMIRIDSVIQYCLPILFPGL